MKVGLPGVQQVGLSISLQFRTLSKGLPPPLSGLARKYERQRASASPGLSASPPAWPSIRSRDHPGPSTQPW